MKRMFNLKSIVLATALTVGMSLSLVSARPHSNMVPAPTPIAAETKVVGGDDACAAALGVAAGLAIGALSPCSILCAVGAWYVGIGGAALLCSN